MLNNYLSVLQQVLVLCCLTSVGYICGKTKIISELSESTLAAITLYIATPCVILSSFERKFDTTLMQGFITILLVIAGIYALNIIVAHVTIRQKEKGHQNVLRFSVVFSNSGFMCLPLAQSLYGEIGSFYCAAIIAVFNFLIWTYGYYLMAGEEFKFSITKILLNPGIIALILGIIVFVFSISFPKPISSSLKHMANLNTPLGMFVIGSRLSRTKMSDIFCDGKAWLATAERLVLLPLLIILLLNAFNIRGVPVIICVIASCAPAASTTTMFAVLFHHDEDTAANIVSSQTVFSALTMPLLVGLAQTLLS